MAHIKRSSALRFLICSLALSLLPLLPAFAQNASTLKKFQTEKHLGTIEDALVGITVTYINDEKQVVETRHGNGIVIRCDGFVLAPEEIFLNRPGKRFKARYVVQIVFHPGSETETTAIAAHPYYFPTTAGCLALKVTNVHSPAIQCLLPYTIKKDDELEVVSSVWSEASKRFSKPERRKVHRGNPDKDDLKLFASQFAEPLDQAFAGSAVIGEEGMLVGIIDGYDGVEKSLSFRNMSILDKVTNCVGAMPTTKAKFEELNPIAADSDDPAASKNSEEETKKEYSEGEMVSISGGPLNIPLRVLPNQTELIGAGVACLPPFKIDKYQVTNEEYLKFWKGQIPGRQTQFFPITWNKTAPYFPPEIARVPVYGITYQAANAYAASKGKRLPTPYEWCLASFGPSGEKNTPKWFHEYCADREQTAVGVVDMHLAQIQKEPLLAAIASSVNVQIGKASPAFSDVGLMSRVLQYVPWLSYDGSSEKNNPLAYKLMLQSMRWSFSTTAPEVSSLMERWKYPLNSMKAGDREFDVSPSGVHDMVLNGEEYVLSPADQFTKSGTALGTAFHYKSFPPKYIDKFGMIQVIANANIAFMDYVVSEICGGDAIAYVNLSRLLNHYAVKQAGRWVAGVSNLQTAMLMLQQIDNWTVEMHPTAKLTRDYDFRTFGTPLNLLSQETLNTWASADYHLPVEIANAIDLPKEDFFIAMDSVNAKRSAGIYYDENGGLLGGVEFAGKSINGTILGQKNIRTTTVLQKYGFRCAR